MARDTRSSDAATFQRAAPPARAQSRPTGVTGVFETVDGWEPSLARRFGALTRKRRAPKRG